MVDWFKRACKVLIVSGFLMLFVSGCQAAKSVADWLTGTSEQEVVDPETGEKTIVIKSDPNSSPLALISGLLGFSQIGTGIAGLYGAARGKKYKKIGAVSVKTARRLWEKRTAIKDAEGRDRMVIFADTAADFFGEFAADQDKAGIRSEARALIHLVENGDKAGKVLTGDA